MTTYKRRRHMRTNQHGTTFHVRSHACTRDGFGTGPSLPATGLRGIIRSRLTIETFTVRASCPVCGAGVYFYQNENGSRVFFNRLGPPWPKHPCTDNGGNILTLKDFKASDIEWGQDGWISLICWPTTVKLDVGEKVTFMPVDEPSNVFEIIFSEKYGIDWNESVILVRPRENTKIWDFSVFDTTSMTSYEIQGKLYTQPRKPLIVR